MMVTFTFTYNYYLPQLLILEDSNMSNVTNKKNLPEKN